MPSFSGAMVLALAGHMGLLEQHTAFGAAVKAFGERLLGAPTSR